MQKAVSRYPELAAFVHQRAIRFGEFTLASGAKSDVYCDGKLVTFDPHGANLVAEAVFSEISPLNVVALGGLEMGAIPIVTAVAMYSERAGHPLKAFVVRKEVKAHGTRKRIEGPIPPPPARIVIVDDVVTKGGSILEAVDVARQQGYQVVLALSILDREEGGAQALAKANVPYRSLVTMSEVRNAESAGVAASCAHCVS